MHNESAHEVENLETVTQTFQVMDKIHRITSVTIPIGNTTCTFLDTSISKANGGSPHPDLAGPKDPDTIVDINWFLAHRENGDPYFNHNDNSYRLRSAGSGSPLMVICRNRHRWDASEEVVPCREDLIEYLANEGLPRPWNVFNMVRLFPTTPRLPFDAVYMPHPAEDSVSSILQDLLEGVDGTVDRFEQCLDWLMLTVNPTHRYYGVNISRDILQKDNAYKVADFINQVFFECGIVLVRRVDRTVRSDNPVGMTVENDLFHDLKLQVDRQAIFSQGKFDSGWAKWLKEEKIDYTI